MVNGNGNGNGGRARNGNRPPPPRTETRNKAAKMMADFAEVHDAHKAEAGYLTGWIDPDLACRGPMTDGAFATTIATFKSSTQISFADTGTSHPHFLAPNSTRSLNNSGSSAVIVCPHYAPPDGTADPGADGGRAMVLRAGWTMDDENYALNTSPLYAGSGDATPVPIPFGTMSSPYPDAPYNTLLQPNPEASAPQSIPHRTVGLRATLTVNSAALGAQGQVYGGDSNRYFRSEHRDYYRYSASFDKYADADAVGGGSQGGYYPELGNNGFQGFSTDYRVRSLGAFRQGMVYESSFIPQNNRVLQYQHVLPAGWLQGDTFQEVNDKNNTLSILANRPAVIFDLKGLQAANSTFTLDVTWAVELGVLAGSSIGIFIANARFSMAYQPNWGVIACCAAAGGLGDLLDHWLNCEKGKLGYVISVTGKSPAYVPQSQGTGAIAPIPHPVHAEHASAFKHGLEEIQKGGEAALAAFGAHKAGLMSKVGNLLRNFLVKGVPKATAAVFPMLESAAPLAIMA